MRRTYAPLSDKRIAVLKATAARLLRTSARVQLPVCTLHRLISEVIDLREELLRLQLCETVDQILAEELDDEDDEEPLTFKWPPDSYLTVDMLMGVKRPGLLRPETGRLSCPAEAPIPSPERDGRRMPRVD